MGFAVLSPREFDLIVADNDAYFLTVGPKFGQCFVEREVAVPALGVAGSVFLEHGCGTHAAAAEVAGRGCLWSDCNWRGLVPSLILRPGHLSRAQ